MHVLGGRLRGLDVVPRTWVLSAGSGVSVAYVAVHLLPEVAAIEEHIDHPAVGWVALLAGLVVFYGVELVARRRRAGDEDLLGWAHLSVHAAYNAVVGYVLVERVTVAPRDAVLFAVAMAVHFLVNDHGLREHHRDLYDRTGRWLVAAGVLAGAATGVVVDVAEPALGVLLAFLAGSVVINVFKEELPEDRGSRWSPFAAAAAVYGAVLLAV